MKMNTKVNSNTEIISYLNVDLESCLKRFRETDPVTNPVDFTVCLIKQIFEKVMIDHNFDWEQCFKGRSFLTGCFPDYPLEIKVIDRITGNYTDYTRFDCVVHDLERNVNPPVTMWVKDGDEIKFLGIDGDLMGDPLSDGLIQKISQLQTYLVNLRNN